ncbi:ycf20-like protein isoform X2 [Andrographis paniculata]|uniref:ycf20-like protein isoform X2 n=1 Tax=Andrographis paniculata TaxID=175694 RepID=UPI0021E96F2D|nr:ycf20-like protein isoform X2 [Andrographis paniculata]
MQYSVDGLMLCPMDILLLHSTPHFPIQRCGRSAVLVRHCCRTLNFNYTPNFSRQREKLELPISRNRSSGVALALNTDGFTTNNDQGNLNENNAFLGGTRLGRIAGAGGRQLLSKLNSARKNFPMKVFLLLLGFYTANALATILGQTGDWDVLVAGIVVAAIEGIGMLMYRRPISKGRLQSLVVMINYWKAGVCLGLFVDAFKLGS